MVEQVLAVARFTCIRSFRPVELFYGGPQRNFCRYGILSLYSLDRGDTRAFSGV